jgi:beta-xylosidase
LPTANDIVRHLHPIMDISIRDFAITKGHDGAYYVTGTSGYPDFWIGNDGSIPVYRSLDLKKWEFLGNVWSFKEAPDWLKEKAKGNMNKISLWAPEIHYIDGNYYIVYSTNAQFIGLLKSTTGKPQGPYKDFLNRQLTNYIDPSLFRDTDKKTYLIYKNMYIALMKSDMSDLAETPRVLKTKEGGYIGFEGISMFKNGSTYFITCAENINEFGYSSIVGSAENPYGPYSSPYLAIPHGGHNNYIQSKEGKWYATMFGFDSNSPFYEQPGIVPMEVNQKGYFQPLGTKDETVMKQKQLIPNGKLGFPWFMTDKVQSKDWFKNDSTFQFTQNGYLAYGEDSASFAANTNGKVGDFYLRKTFEVSFDKISLLTLTYKFKGQASFYLNGLNVGENIKCSGKLQCFSLSGAVLKSMHKGQNVFSIELKTDNPSNIEFGLQAWVREMY